MADLRVKPKKFNLSAAATSEASPKNVKDKTKALQIKLLTYQQACYQQKKRVLLVFEGTDTAGKGGAIRRVTRYLDPRGLHVWPIGAPTAEENEHHYLHRFWQRMPDQGQIAIFDRSWYGRVLVERIEGFCSEADWKRAYDEINDFEKLFTDSGVMVLKFHFHLSNDEQKQRLINRIKEPTKRWKITAADLTTRDYWGAYQKAYEDMLVKTSTKNAPWFCIPADNKESARYNVLSILTKEFEKFVDVSSVQVLDPTVLKLAEKYLGEGVIPDDIS